MKWLYYIYAARLDRIVCVVRYPDDETCELREGPGYSYKLPRGHCERVFPGGTWRTDNGTDNLLRDECMKGWFEWRDCLITEEEAMDIIDGWNRDGWPRW